MTEEQLPGAPETELIRRRLDSLYDSEPVATAELQDARTAGPQVSKYQQHMINLSQSGRSLAEISRAWHDYYQSLPDNDKHALWQEFYSLHGKRSVYYKAVGRPTRYHNPSVVPVAPATTKARSIKSMVEIKQKILQTLSEKAKGKHKQNIKSLAFGLGMGSLTILFLLFGFFNERFLAPFITPSRAVSSTPIIVDPNSSAVVGNETKVIIPKINVEVPVVYDEKSIEEPKVQKALERGVVHYATTSTPGQDGNAVIVGHSSNNILNRGAYKFAFVLLNKLEVGDTFVMTYEGKRFVYKIYEKKIVPPDDVSVLGKTNKRATVSLLTCDPPGTSTNRLIVIGEQISPDLNSNIASNPGTNAPKPAIVPGNAPSLWQRLKAWLVS